MPIEIVFAMIAFAVAGTAAMTWPVAYRTGVRRTTRRHRGIIKIALSGAYGKRAHLYPELKSEARSYQYDPAKDIELRADNEQETS